MKDHELRELVNALTATAREFAETQQLRERIAGLVRPAIEQAWQDGHQAGREKSPTYAENQELRDMLDIAQLKHERAVDVIAHLLRIHEARDGTSSRVIAEQMLDAALVDGGAT